MASWRYTLGIEKASKRRGNWRKFHFKGKGAMAQPVTANGVWGSQDSVAVTQ